MRGNRIGIGWIALLALPPLVTGCRIGGCLVQGRGIALYAVMDGGDIGMVSPAADSAVSSVTFGQSRGAGAGDEHTVGWLIRAWTLQGFPTAVRLREGTPTTPGAILYTFPHEVEFASMYRGTVPFEELLRRTYQGPTFLEIVTDVAPQGELRGRLGTPPYLHPPDDATVWHDQCT
jgi:hypothetical protein